MSRSASPLFYARVIPTNYRMPSSFSAGTSVVYRRMLEDYKATEGWTMSAFIGPAVATVTTDGDVFIVTFPASATVDMAGTYQFEERVELGELKFTSDRLKVVVSANVETLPPEDYLSWAEQTLAALEASLMANVGDDVLRYSIGQRTLEHYSLEERLALRNQLKAEIRQAKGGTGLRPVIAYFTGTGLKQ